MSGLEIVVIVGGAIFITKKVRERKEKKRLEKNAASGIGAAHGRAEIAQAPTRNGQNGQNGRLRQQVPRQQEEALPMYRAPAGPLPSTNTTDMTWSNAIHLPTYDELSGSIPAKDFTTGDEKQRGDGGLLGADSNQVSSPSTPLASPLPSAPQRPPYLSPPAPNNLSSDTSEKKRKFWRRLSSSKVPAT